MLSTVKGHEGNIIRIQELKLQYIYGRIEDIEGKHVTKESLELTKYVLKSHQRRKARRN